MGTSEQESVGYEAHFTTVVTEKMVQQFGEMCGDFNPMHFDEEYAQKTRFKGRIAHGMIVGALISRALNDGLGGGGIYLSQNMKFVNPVRINDAITVNIKVLSVRKEKGLASIETNAVNQNGEFVVKGDAMIMMSKGIM
jgi:3-hydroxybutyryl-CoA dehydratase